MGIVLPRPRGRSAPPSSVPARVLAAVGLAALALLAGDAVAVPAGGGGDLGPGQPGRDYVAPAPAAARGPEAAAPAPAPFRALPAGTRQVIRVTRSSAFCPQRYCTVVEAWARDAEGRWARVKIADRAYTVRSQIGRNGFAAPGAKREGDGRTPTGVYDIVTVFSTDARNPGARMPWMRRTARSNVSESPGRLYNTWREVPGGAAGNRPAMRYGVWVNYNHGRLAAGRGTAPVPGLGSGIFVHVRSAARPYEPSAACVIAAPEYVRWMLLWLDPKAAPRVLLNV
jgi:L,D-peptidoglycan transpeptidase YkuD (ErfK/YbiS/YcfS/YnhG family)